MIHGTHWLNGQLYFLASPSGGVYISKWNKHDTSRIYMKNTFDWDFRQWAKEFKTLEEAQKFVDLYRHARKA